VNQSVCVPVAGLDRQREWVRCTAEGVLTGVTTAIWVDGGICIAAAVAVALFLLGRVETT